MGKKAWLQNWVKENIDREKIKADLLAQPIASMYMDRIDEMVRNEVRRQAFAAWEKTDAGRAEVMQGEILSALNVCDVLCRESNFKAAQNLWSKIAKHQIEADRLRNDGKTTVYPLQYELAGKIRKAALTLY